MTERVEMPLACSLGAAEQVEREEEIRGLFERALTGRRREPRSLELRFRGEEGVEEAVRDLARRERECCPFLEIAVAERGGEVVVRVSAPDPAALDALDPGPA